MAATPRIVARSASRRGGVRAPGFTLVEILLVIAIIAILIAIVVPGLGHARATARMIREQAGAEQLLIGWTTYAQDYRETMVPCYANWAWEHNTNNQWAMQPPDPENPGTFITGTPVKPWPWRFIGYTSLPYATIVFESKRLAIMRGLGQSTATVTSNFQYTFSEHPTMGMNGVYVSGHFLNGGFSWSDGRPGTRSVAQGGLGEFYVTQLHQVRRVDNLLVFASAATENGNPAAGTDESYYYVRPPRPHPAGMLSNTIGGGWTNTADLVNPGITVPPVNTGWGFVRPRHFGRAVTAMVDGHVRMQSTKELRDMRKWSNYADKADWTFVPH